MMMMMMMIMPVPIIAVIEMMMEYRVGRQMTSYPSDRDYSEQARKTLCIS